MADITEDYVSFKTAKLLKEKGFDEPCHCFYEYRKRLYNDMDKYFPNGMKNSDHDKEGNKGVSAPTFQMAMKWLREVHNIVIEIRVSHHFKIFDGYSAEFVKIGGDVSYDYYLLNNKRTYEEVVEAAIKYALENLI